MTLTVTSRAAQRIREIVAMEPGRSMLRVSVEGEDARGFSINSIWSAPLMPTTW